MEKQLKVLGIACIVLGSITTVMCYYSLVLALPIGFLGMICSGIYVFIDTKYQINTSSITPGIISLVLNSTPVLVILCFTIYSHFNHHIN